MSLITGHEEREIVKLDKIRNEGGRHTNITTDTEEIEIIMREYCMQLCETSGTPTVSWYQSITKISPRKKMENVNRPITIKEIRR